MRKPMVKERVEVNSPKSEHYPQQQNLQMIPYLLSKFQRSKWEGLCNLTEIEWFTKGYGNFLKSANMNRP